MNGSRPQGRLPPLAVIAGIRTPFAKALTALADVPAAELGRLTVEAALARCNISAADVDEVVFGNVAGPPDAVNVARVIALRAGIPENRPAHTVNRNCASGMESVIAAWQIIHEGRGDVIVAGGAESMSNVPLLWDKRMQPWLLKFNKASAIGKLKLLSQLKPSVFKPVIGLELGLTDPVSGLNMGETVEVLAKEFQITREQQDQFALESHRKTTAAWESGFFDDEVIPVSVSEGPPVTRDVGPRAKQSLEALAKLRPFFDPRNGTVTAGNSCPITDGAVALVVVPAAKAKALGTEPLGYLRGYAVAGCDPRRMGLGPVFATSRLLQSSGLSLRDFDLIEINEAFAAQVISCVQAMASRAFAEKELGTSTPVGTVDPERLNLHGGAIALGHPVGASGTRLILTLLRSLRDRGKQRGLATLCVGGGQGAAVWVERTLED